MKFVSAQQTQLFQTYDECLFNSLEVTSTFYRHYYIVEDKNNHLKNNTTKYSNWTLLNAYQYSTEFNVRIIKTQKKVNGRGRKSLPLNLDSYLEDLDLSITIWDKIKYAEKTIKTTYPEIILKLKEEKLELDVKSIQEIIFNYFYFQLTNEDILRVLEKNES